MPKAAPKLPKINKCPVCGKKASLDCYGIRHYVVCTEYTCLSGPVRDDARAAIAAWNKLRSEK